MQKLQTIPENTEIFELHTLLYWNEGGLNYSWYSAIPEGWERRTILKQMLLLFFKNRWSSLCVTFIQKNLLKVLHKHHFSTRGEVQEGMLCEAYLFLVWLTHDF